MFLMFWMAEELIIYGGEEATQEIKELTVQQRT